MPGGGVLGSSGGETELTFFYDDDDDARITRLTVVVVWRGPARGAGPGRRQLLRRLWPFGQPLPPPPPRPTPPPGPPPGWSLRPDWTSARGPGSPREILVSRERRVARVRGRDYPIPDGRTLVLMVWEPPDGSDAITVTPHALAVPPLPRPAPDRTAPGIARPWRSAADVRGAERQWTACLASDPVVGEFMNRPRRSGGP